MKKFSAYFWSKHSNPLSGWSRFIVGMLFPIAIYSHDFYFLIIVFVFILINPILFPKPKESMKIDFMYHVVRGEYLLKNKEIPCYSNFWSKFLGFQHAYLLLSLIGFLLSFMSFYLLWNQYLIFGSLVYYVLCMGLKWSYCTECANASRSHPKNNLWDSI